MPMFKPLRTRRAALALIAAAAAVPLFRVIATEDDAAEAAILVHKDPNCGCCTAWVEHLREAGFAANAIDTGDLRGVKARLGVPDDLAACHTAEMAGYVLEGHVPARAVLRLLAMRPAATGLAVPGMPLGSPGMEGDRVETYDVILFAPGERTTFMTFHGAQAI